MTNSTGPHRPTASPGPRALTAAALAATALAATLVVSPTASAEGPGAARAEPATATRFLTSTDGDALAGPLARGRQVRMLKCRRTVVDTGVQRVFCVRPRPVTVWAMKTGGRWAVGKSARGRDTVVPYVWSRGKRALVFSPRLAWQDQTGTQPPTGSDDPSLPPIPVPPADPGPPRKPESPAPPAPTVTPDGGSASSFAFHNGIPTSSPLNAARWDRCTRIRWAADLSRAAAYGIDPAIALAALSAAFSDVAAVTGYTFEFVGRVDGELTDQTTGQASVADTPWSSRYEIGISFGAEGDAAGYNFTSLAGSTLGLARTLSYSFDNGTRAMRLSSILVDADDLTPTAAPGGPPVLVEWALYSVVRHELAHVVGLAHVDDPTQLMNPTVTSGLSTYQNGDRAGMWLLASQPCFPSYN